MLRAFIQNIGNFLAQYAWKIRALRDTTIELEDQDEELKLNSL